MPDFDAIAGDSQRKPGTGFGPDRPAPVRAALTHVRG